MNDDIHPGIDVGVHVAAMLEHPSWSGVEVLAGARGKQRRLSGGVVVSDLAARPADLRGALLVIVLSSDRTDWRLDAMLARARDAGAGAVLIAGTTPVRGSTEMLSDRLGLSLLGAMEPLAAYTALTALTGEPELVRANVVLRSVAACQRAGSSVEDVLSGLERVLQRAVALLDQGGGRVAGSQVLRDGDRDLVVQQLGRRTASLPGPVHLELASGAVLVACPLTGVGKTSWLVVRLPAVLRPEGDAVAAAVAVASTAVQERLALRRLQLERTARGRTSLLAELLHSTGDVPVATRRRALDIGWRLDGWQIGIRIGAIGDVDVAGLRADIVTVFDAEGLTTVVVEQGDGWSAWTTAEHEPSAAEVEQHAAAVRRAQRRLGETVQTYVGVGRVHAGPSGIARSLAEAGDAARLALGRAETGRFLHVDRLGLAQLLHAWTRTDTFQPAADALLAPLVHEAGDLAKTLAAYLDAESSLAEAAAVLGVHRNTVSARVARIQHVLGVDLSDPDQRLALHLACRTAMLSTQGGGNHGRG